MTHRRVARVVILGLAVVGAWSSTQPASAETLIQSTLDSRIALAFRANAAEIQRWLPAPWQVNPVAAGPSKDANLSLTFIDRLLDQTAEGKPAAVPVYRIVGLSIPAKHPQTGDSGPLIIRIFNSNPQAVPGFYKTAVSATVRREQTVKGASVEAGAGSDWWEMRDSKGIPSGIDRVQSYQLRVAVPELAKLFDGSEQLVSITAIPSYTRQTFLP